MKKNRYILMALLTVVICLSWTISVFASDLESRDSRLTGEVSNAESEESEIRPQWGTEDFPFVSIPAIAFRHTNSDTTYAYSAGGSFYKTGGPDYFDAPLYLPNGAILRFVDLYFYDDNASADVSYSVSRYYGQENSQSLYYGMSTGSPGFGNLLSSDIAHTVDNFVNHYVIYVSLPATDSSLRIRKAIVYYQLQVSPAPAVATFTDVPTSHQYFQFIEALADSGITTGYPDGTFRPGSYVTRGQMAVFLSKSLGLHWPD